MALLCCFLSLSLSFFSSQLPVTVSTGEPACICSKVFVACKAKCSALNFAAKPLINRVEIDENNLEECQRL